MSAISLSIEHGRTLAEAQDQLRSAVSQVQSRFAAIVQRVEWSADGTAVKMFGKGFDLDLRVDAQRLHASGNLTLLGGLLSGPFAAGVKQILGRAFARRLT